MGEYSEETCAKLRERLGREPTAGEVKTELEARDERIEFIIRARADIQNTLFALYRFLRDAPEILNHPRHQEAFQLLVGAAFSLWRAIFLTEADRDWKSIRSSVLQFLDKVVTDNAITYHDDKTN